MKYTGLMAMNYKCHSVSSHYMRGTYNICTQKSKDSMSKQKNLLKE